TADAGIVRSDGTVIPIRKYQPPRQPGLTTSSKHSATPAVRRPAAGETRVSPSASTPGPISTATAGDNGLASAQVSPPSPPSPTSLDSPAPPASPPTTANAPRPPPARLEVTTSALPPATVGDNYAEQLTAAGGTPPYTWSESGLPPGLDLD